MTSESNTKKNEGKPPLQLLPLKALIGAAKVLEYGANEKYGKHNWHKGVPYSDLVGSALRHIFLFNEGQDLDLDNQYGKGSGLCHIWHAIVNLMFLAEFYETRSDLDDRHTTQQKLLSRAACKELTKITEEMGLYEMENRLKVNDLGKTPFKYVSEE